jgi:hypothetical protein
LSTGPLEIFYPRQASFAAENWGAAMKRDRRIEEFGALREGRATEFSFAVSRPTSTRSPRSSSNTSSLPLLNDFRDDISGGQQRPVD